MVITFDTIREDVEAFADDIGESMVDRASSMVMFVRNGKDIQFKVLKDDSAITHIEFEGERVPYKQFLSRNIANLDLLAERLISKRKGVEAFINSPAKLDSIDRGNESGKALDLLTNECHNSNGFNSKVVFITADAGHGKTALLREFQFVQAKKYIERKSDFIFWHIDLQGRQLLRLSEALMGDLGELRIPGLWMQSIIRLVKHGKLVIGIDGFDELAAEQGSNDALGALALLLNQMGNNGTLIAASRRTFFNTDDYLKRSKLVQGKVENFCTFNQIHLKDWSKDEAIEYLSHKKVNNPEDVYNSACLNLGGQENHPILTRPFLLSQLATALVNYNISTEEFIGGMSNPHDPNKGVNSIIEALVNREVTDKWKSKDTGQPYLNKSQHIQLLSVVAEEMWKSQVEKLSLDYIQTITVLLLEEWQISDKVRQQQIFEMVKMHALLIIPNDGDNNSRSFEHPEFKDYFTAQSLEDLVTDALRVGQANRLGSFLSVAQISDSLALYTFANTKLENKDVSMVLDILSELVKKEWRPTYLQNNVGTLIPYLINNFDLNNKLIFDAKVVFSSLIFENKVLRNFTISNGTFINTSFRGTIFSNIVISNSELNEVVFDYNVNLSTTTILDCTFNGLKIYYNEEDFHLEYVPELIQRSLKSFGAEVIDSRLPISFPEEIKEHEIDKSVYRFLRAMHRTTFISKHSIETRLKSDKREILDTIIPTMVKYGILEERKEKGQVWMLRASYQDLSLAQNEKGESDIHKFWKEIHE